MRRSFRSLFAAAALFAALFVGTASADVSGKYLPNVSSLIADGDYLYGVVNYEAPDSSGGTVSRPVRVYKFDKDLKPAGNYVELSDENGTTGFDAAIRDNIGRVIAVRNGKLYVATRKKSNSYAGESTDGGLLFEVDAKDMTAALKAQDRARSDFYPFGAVAVASDGTIFVTDGESTPNLVTAKMTDFTARFHFTDEDPPFSKIAFDGTSNVGAVWNEGEKFLMTSGSDNSIKVGLDIRETTDLRTPKKSFDDTALNGSAASYAPLNIDLSGGDKIVAIVVADKVDPSDYSFKHTVSTIKKTSGGDYEISAQLEDISKGSEPDTKVFALGDDRALVVDIERNEKIEAYGYLFTADALKADTTLAAPKKVKLPVPSGEVFVEIIDVILVGDFIYVSANVDDQPGQFCKIALSDLTKTVAASALKAWPEDSASVKPALPEKSAEDDYDADLNIVLLTSAARSYTDAAELSNDITASSFKAEDFEVNPDGYVVIKSEDITVAAPIFLALSEDVPPTDPKKHLDPTTLKLTSLPVGWRRIAPGRNPADPVQTTVVFSFLIDGDSLAANTRNSILQLCKIYEKDSAKAAKLLRQVDTLNALTDGTFMITYQTNAGQQNLKNTALRLGEAIDPEKTYTINVAIKDEGDYDLRKNAIATDRVVVDPLVLAQVSETSAPLPPIDPAACTDGPGSCDAGFGIFAAAAAAAALIARKKR